MRAPGYTADWGAHAMRASPGEAVYSAARSGDGVALARLLREKPGVVDWRHPRNGAQTALYTAAKYGRQTCVALLLENGANATLASDGLCPIHVACLEGKSGVVEALLRVDASLANLPTQDDVHMTPLYVAAMEGRTSVVQVLLKFGALPNLTDTHGYACTLHRCDARR